MTFGTPVAMIMMLTAGVLHIGLMGRQMSDAHREWWGRLGGWLLIYSFCWFCSVPDVDLLPQAMGKLLSWEQNTHPNHPLTFTGVLVWVASTAYGVAFGKGDRSGELKLDPTKSQKLWHYLARVTPYVFIIGLLLGLSLLAAKISDWLTGVEGSSLDFRVTSIPIPARRLPMRSYLSPRSSVVARRHQRFSIHYLYRNRLIRCYLGASVRDRRAQPFTGFSDADNFPLSSLKIPDNSENPKDARPIPIVNTSLNVVRGKELALQTRKARSFAFTPLYGGFTRQHPEGKAWESFFGPTEQAGCLLPGYEQGITLGTSIAISGAAASPNMGSYSEPPLAFLMTLFDVRLGWWIGNPARDKWKHGSPAIGFIGWSPSCWVRLLTTAATFTYPTEAILRISPFMNWCAAAAN